MNRVTMLHVLRRRIQESVPENWTDQELQDLLNEAYFWVQMEYYKINPDGLIHIDYTSLEAGKWLYPWVRGFIYAKEMAYKDTANATGYRDLGPPRAFFVNRNSTPATEISWSNFGRHFAIFPVPPVNITDGIQKMWVGTLGLANDNDVPEIPFNHMAIVARAQIMTYAESGDATKDLREELGDYMSGMTLAKPDNYAGNPTLSITGLGKTSRWGNTGGSR